MEAVKKSEVPPPQGSAARNTVQFVPAMPTLWPSMLLSGPSAAPPFPFESPGVTFYYFARNAVWTLSRILGLHEGEVLVPAYHHGVEVEALIDAGVTVKYYRVDAKMGIDPDDVAKLITHKTRAIYLIHYIGFAGPARELKALADKHGIPLIEDCALSLLAKDGDRPLGTFGDASVFCLYKTIPVPNGGALVMNGALPRGVPRPPGPPALSVVSHLAGGLLQNMELRAGALGRALRQTARDLSRTAFRTAGVERVATGTQHFDRTHVNLGMSAISKRIALAQRWPQIVERRRRNYFALLSKLRDQPVVFNELPPGACPLFFPLRVNDKDKIGARLAKRGVETIPFWNFGHPSCPAADFPEVEGLRRSVLEIPCHQDLDADTMTFVADAVRDALRSD